MAGEITEIELGRIQPNPFNPRLDFDNEELSQLAQNIKEKGMLQPIIVRPVQDHYEVVIGERRYKAPLSPIFPLCCVRIARAPLKSVRKGRTY